MRQRLISGSPREAGIPRSITRNLIIFLLSMVLVLGTQMVRNHARADTENKENKYLKVLEGENFRDDIENVEDSVDELVQTYHETINDLFNERIAITVKKLLNDDKPLSEKDLKDIMKLLAPPPIVIDKKTQKPKREECKGAGEDPPLSTYCLAQAAVQEYFQFREAMLTAKVQARETAAQKFTTLSEAKGDSGAASSDESKLAFENRNIFGAFADLIAGDKSLQGYGEVINRIDRELDIARQSLDQALAAYSELQMALPLHRKYKDVIEALEKYRDYVSGIRKEIDLYPVTFLDVTTTACT